MDKIDFLQIFKKIQNLATDLGPVLALFIWAKPRLFLLTFVLYQMTNKFVKFNDKCNKHSWRRYSNS